MSPIRSESGLTLESAVIPMFLLYIASYVLITQDFIPEPTKEIFGLKLLAGALILGYFSLRVLKNIPGIRLGVPIREISWSLIALAFLAGLFLLCLALYLHNVLNIPIDVQRGLLYYGPFSFFSYELYVIAPLLIAYVVAEEMYFRGLLYIYLKGKLGTVLGTFLTTVLFVAAHLNVLAPRIIMLTVLSLFAIWLLERTGTLLYGICMHAVLNIASILIITDGLWGFLPPFLPTLLVLLCVVTGMICLEMLYGRKSQAF